MSTEQLLNAVPSGMGLYTPPTSTLQERRRRARYNYTAYVVNDENWLIFDDDLAQVTWAHGWEYAYKTDVEEARRAAAEAGVEESEYLDDEDWVEWHDMEDVVVVRLHGCRRQLAEMKGNHEVDWLQVRPAECLFRLVGDTELVEAKAFFAGLPDEGKAIYVSEFNRPDRLLELGDDNYPEMKLRRRELASGRLRYYELDGGVYREVHSRQTSIIKLRPVG